MELIIVRTKEELKAAVESGANQILVLGELAENLNTALKIKSASKWAIGLLAAPLAAAPATGGLSLWAAAPAASLTGIEIVAIIAAAAIGIALILLICREYRKVRFKGKKGDNEAELELEREGAAAS
jgi:hypothetical protein